MPQPELTDTAITGESNAVGGRGAQDPRWERVFDFFKLCCVEKDTPEVEDTTRRVFPALFWECSIALRSMLGTFNLKTPRSKLSTVGSRSFFFVFGP